MKWFYSILIVFSIFIFLGIFGLYLINFHDGLSIHPIDWGAFGDYFGGVASPLIAFAALIALLYTIHLQRVEIREAKELFQQQNFINIFYNLINYLELKKSLNKIGKLSNIYSQIVKDGDNDKWEGRKATFRGYYSPPPFRFFLKNLAHIIKTIDKQCNERNKAFYFDFLKNEIGNYIWTGLFYFCLLEKNQEDLKSIIERYHIFDNGVLGKLFLIENHWNRYKSSAYGDDFERLDFYMKTQIEM